MVRKSSSTVGDEPIRFAPPRTSGLYEAVVKASMEGIIWESAAASAAARKILGDVV
jgi:hypothetical protein